MLRREELEASTGTPPGTPASGARGAPGDPVPEFILERLVVHEKHGTSFILVPGRETQTGDDILLTQKDVRETQLAKGAIFAGYQILKAVLGVKDEDVAEVLLAGAFGAPGFRENGAFLIDP